MPVDAYHELVQYITQIFSNQGSAHQFIADGSGDLIAQGISDYPYTDEQVRQAIYEACDNAGLPADTRSALQSYTRGESGPPPHSGPADVATHITYATQVVYDNDEYIQQTIIDQSSDINVAGDVFGSITQDNDPVNVMAGDGGTAVSEQGDGNAAVASGEGSQAIGGDNLGAANTGDGAVVAGPGATIDGPVNTGTFTGVQADGPVSNAIVGDGNQAAQVTGNAQDAVFNFGGGSVVDVSGSPGAVTSLGGDATNQIGNVVGPGGALSGSGDASGHYEDNDTTVNDNDTTVTTTVNDDHSTHQDLSVHDDHSTHQDFSVHSVTALDHSSAEEGPGDQTTAETETADA